MSLIYKLLIPVLAIGAFTLFSAELMNGSGSPGGKTGSPGDGGASCTQCHFGTASLQTGWITSNIPPAGYIPGQTYTITTTLTHAGAGRYGFELTAENSSNVKIGTFIITNTTQTKLTNASKAVTHTFSGTTGSGGSKTWSFDWQAPSAGAGPVTFYAAFNAADGNGTTSGDIIYTSTLLVPENMSTGILSLSSPEELLVYPNPAIDMLHIQKMDKGTAELLRLVDLAGKTWIQQDMHGTQLTLALNQIPRGIYFVMVGNKASRKLILQ